MSRTTKKSQAIPGFKVMEWLEKVRKEDYNLRKEDPEQYAMEMNKVRREMRAQFGTAGVRVLKPNPAR